MTAVPGDGSEDATADPVPFDEDVAVDVESPEARLVDVEAEPSEDDAATVAAPCAASALVKPTIAARLMTSETNRARSAG